MSARLSRTVSLAQKGGSDERLARFLSSSKWLSQLPPEDQQQVMGCVREVRVPVGGVVIRCGDPAEHWFGVMGGLLVQVVSADTGKLTELTIASPGLWLGEGTLLKKERWRYDLVALRRSHIAVIPIGVFEHLRNTSLAFNHFLQELLNARLGLCVSMLVADRLLDPDAKVARLLASFYLPEHPIERGPFLPIRQAELAMLAGLSRQRTNVALKKLRALDCIEIRRDGICVRDLAALRSFEPRHD